MRPGGAERFDEVKVESTLMVHGTAADDLAYGCVRLEFHWTGAGERDYLPLTQNEMLLSLQNGAMFHYRTLSTLIP
jgi:hypothetical protein